MPSVQTPADKVATYRIDGNVRGTDVNLLAYPSWENSGAAYYAGTFSLKTYDKDGYYMGVQPVLPVPEGHKYTAAGFYDRPLNKFAVIIRIGYFIYTNRVNTCNISFVDGDCTAGYCGWSGRYKLNANLAVRLDCSYAIRFVLVILDYFRIETGCRIFVM